MLSGLADHIPLDQLQVVWGPLALFISLFWLTLLHSKTQLTYTRSSPYKCK